MKTHTGSLHRDTRLIAIAAVIALALSIAAHGSNTLPGDVTIARFVQRAPGGIANPLTDIGYIIGSSRFIALSVLIVSGMLLLRHRPRDAAVYALVMLTHLINGPLKSLADSPRPSALQIRVPEHVNGLGFPSGHAMGAAQLCGGLVLVLDPMLPPGAARTVVRVTLSAVVLNVGFARVYAGAHWPSDVVGGWLYGLLTVWLVALARARWPGMLRDPVPGTV